MKKFIFIAAAALACAISANAQEKQYKPEAMDFSLEMNYTPGTIGRFVLPEYGVKGRLFISDRFAVKLNLGFTTNSDKTVSYTQQASSTGNGTTETSSETKETSTLFSIMPGVEYHFGNFNRVSPYVGAAIGIMAGSSNTIPDIQNAPETSIKRPAFGFGIQASAGVDVYICQGLYAGVELGLGYSYAKDGRGETTTISPDQSVTKADGPTENMFGSFGFSAIPSLRIGWFF